MGRYEYVDGVLTLVDDEPEVSNDVVAAEKAQAEADTTQNWGYDTDGNLVLESTGGVAASDAEAEPPAKKKRGRKHASTTTAADASDAEADDEPAEGDSEAAGGQADSQ